MADEIFDFELDGADGGLAAPEPQLRQRVEGPTDGIALATPSAAHDDGPVLATGSGALACSVPISIPAQLSFRRRKDGEGTQAPDSDSFVPPHTLSQAALAESLPLSSSSRIRTRNKVFQSMGYLPTNSQQGFLVSRASDRSGPSQQPTTTASVPAQSAFASAAARSSGGSARVPAINTRLDAADSGSEQSTPGAASTGRSTRDFGRTTTGLSIAAAIPERDDLEAPSL